LILEHRNLSKSFLVEKDPPINLDKIKFTLFFLIETIDRIAK